MSRLSLPNIDQYAATMGTFDIEDEDTDAYRQGSMVVMVVVASVGGGTLKTSEADGSTKWTHKIKPVGVRVATGDMRDELVDLFNLVTPGDQLSFELGDRPMPRPKPEPVLAPAAAAETDNMSGEQSEEPTVIGDFAPPSEEDEPEPEWVPPTRSAVAHVPAAPAPKGPSGPAPRDAPGIDDFFAAPNPTGVIRAG